MSEKPIISPIDPLDNPGGAVLQVFFEGKMPDGTPLSDDEVHRLAPSLIEALSADESFMNRFRNPPFNASDYTETS